MDRNSRKNKNSEQQTVLVEISGLKVNLSVALVVLLAGLNFYIDDDSDTNAGQVDSAQICTKLEAKMAYLEEQILLYREGQ